MKLKKGQLIELTITDMAFGGKGLARVDGIAVFIDKTVPGDIIVGRIIKKKKNYLEARVEEMITPSPYRVKARCEYSGFCGGCKWQFIDYKKQLEYKRKHVIDSLEHIGFIKDVLVHETIPSKLIFGYRNKMEFSCSDRRWLLPEELGKSDADISFALGLHVPGTYYKVLDNKYCLLQPDTGNEILTDVNAFMKNSGYPVYGLRSHTGFWRFLMLRHSAAYNQWMVNIITANNDRAVLQPLADMLTAKYPEIVSVINNVTSKKAGVATGEYEIVLSGDPHIKDKIGLHQFEISSNSFFQTNTSGAEILYSKVKEYADLSGSENVLDLYCGTGTIAICLSDSANEITGLEIAESAVADALNNCRINKITNCKFILGEIRSSIQGITQKPDVIIIDPPRAGMHKDVIKHVLELAPEKIVYVSCNPATLARDLGVLNENYKVLEIQPVDMFPHTYHIESVAKIQKKQSG